MLDYRGVGLARFHCTMMRGRFLWCGGVFIFNYE